MASSVPKAKERMKRSLLWRNQQHQSSEPSSEQMKTAEDTAFSAMRRGNAVLVRNTPFQDRMIMSNGVPETEVPVVEGEPLGSVLGKTTVDVFLSNFRVNGLECMSTAYQMQRQLHHSSVTGFLTTALPEDLFHLIGSQLSLLDEYLRAKHIIGTSAGDNVAIEAVLSIVRNLWYNHHTYRFTFLRDVESSIAAANDLMRMLDMLEEMMGEIAHSFSRLNWEDDQKDYSTAAAVRREAADLASNFSSDAVNAAQRAVNYIIINIQNSHISADLFSQKWEDIMTHNEVALSIVKTFEDYLTDIRNYLEHDFLYHKVVAALVRSTVCFYTQCFVKKAQNLRRAMSFAFSQQPARKIAFLNPRRAITRITHDVQVFKDYFTSLAKESRPLLRIISEELSIFVIFIECMWLAVGRAADESMDEFVVVVHKKISGANSAVTRHFLSDLWLLMGPKNKHLCIEKEIRMMELELKKMSTRVKEEAPSCRTTINQGTELRLDEVLRVLYEDRIFQENWLCIGAGRIMQKTDHGPNFNHRKPWDPLKEIRKRMAQTKCEKELSSMMKNMN